MPIVIALVGMPGAQKSKIGKKIVEKDTYIELSNYLAYELLDTNKSLTPGNYQLIAKELRSKYGPYVLIEKAINDISKLEEEELVIIDGLRTIDEWKWIKSHFNNSYLIAIHASPKTRYNFLLTKAKDIKKNIQSKQPPRTILECEDLDKANLKLGVSTLISLADYMIINESYSLIDAYDQFVKIIELIKNNPL